MEINSKASLDLYAKVEDLLGIEEAVASLYTIYSEFIETASCQSLLDVGCGSGAFLSGLKNKGRLQRVKGIDLSPLMVQQTQARGIDAESIDLCDLEGKFDIITAVFDMVNYLDAESLYRFLGCISEHLHEDGYFIFDINTLFGFEEVAAGTYIVDDESRFLAIDSMYEEGEYRMEMTLFENCSNGFEKFQQQIRQYYHEIEQFALVKGMKLVSSEEIFLYGLEEADKLFIVLQKRAG